MQARGLCYLCGEKWPRGHKCATIVQLHVVQELFDVLGFSNLDTQSVKSDTSSKLHTISRVALEAAALTGLVFFSKALGPRNRGLSSYEKEFMAILAAVDQWRYYLQQGEFVIRMDRSELLGC